MPAYSLVSWMEWLTYWLNCWLADMQYVSIFCLLGRIRAQKWLHKCSPNRTQNNSINKAPKLRASDAPSIISSELIPLIENGLYVFVSTTQTCIRLDHFVWILLITPVSFSRRTLFANKQGGLKEERLGYRFCRAHTLIKWTEWWNSSLSLF